MCAVLVSNVGRWILGVVCECGCCVLHMFVCACCVVGVLCAWCVLCVVCGCVLCCSERSNFSDRVAQWIAHLTSNQGVVGSSPIAVDAESERHLAAGRRGSVSLLGRGSL